MKIQRKRVSNRDGRFGVTQERTARSSTEAKEAGKPQRISVLFQGLTSKQGSIRRWLASCSQE